MYKKSLVLTIGLILCGISVLHAAQVLFTPAIELSEQYTDNLFLTPENGESAYITAGGLDLTGQILWRTAGIELNYSPTYYAYDKNDDLNYWRHEVNFYTWKQFQRNTKIELRDTYLYTRNPTDQSAQTVTGGQTAPPIIGTDRNRRGQREYYTNVSEARLTQQLGTNSQVYAAYEYRILRDVNPPPGFPVADNNIATPSLGLVYDISSRWGMVLDNTYAITDYKAQTDRNEYNGNFRLLYRFDRVISGFFNFRHTILDFDRTEEDDYKIYLPTIGCRFDLQNNARIDISAGYYLQDFKTADNQEGLIVTSDIYKRWNYRSGYFDISGASGYVIDDNGVEDNGLNIYYQGGVEIGYYFTSKLTGSVFGNYRYDDYPDQSPDRTEYTTIAGLALDWNALQWMVVGLGYDFSDVRSDIAFNEYTENRVMLTIRIAPSSPMRFN